MRGCPLHVCLPLLLLWTTAAALLGGPGRPLARRHTPTPASFASDDLYGRLKDLLSEAPGEESAESFRLALTSVDDLAAKLLPLVGVTLAPRVADLAHSPGFVTAQLKPPLGLFEERASELMAAGRWLEAHDVVAGELLDADAQAEAQAGRPPHAHDARLAARLLEGICQHELACADGLGAALEAHAAQVATPLACGCALSAQAVEPFADLAAAVAAMGQGDANTALGHALASGLGRASLAPVAARVAQRAVLAIEPASMAADAAVTGVGEARVDARSPGDARSAPGVQDLQGPGEQAEGGGAAAALPALEAIERLVGLAEAKELCRNLAGAIALEKERGDDPTQRSLSLMLTGNPGTGKTLFATLYAQLLGELKVLPEGRVVRVTGAQLQDDGVAGLEAILKEFDKPGTSALQVGDLVEGKRNGEWGHLGRIVYHDTSAESRGRFKDTYDVHFGEMVSFTLANGSVDTRRDNDFEIGMRRSELRAQQETGGVLFIDDAHQLDPSSDKHGRQVLYRLADEMDKRGGGLAVLMAGYDKPLHDQVLGFNYGALLTRFRRRLALPDFDEAQLIELLTSRLAELKPRYHVSDPKYVRIAARRLGRGRGDLGFGNARAVAALVEEASERQTARVMAARAAASSGSPPSAPVDVFEITRGDLLGQSDHGFDPASSAPLRRLRAMEGLANVKAAVDSLLSLAESNAAREELELPPAEVSLNRIFLGNPGTGKTTVARHYGQILRELGLLSKGEVVLATPADLIGSALGQSEEKTNALLDKAAGCVLVIDEAYGLDPNGAGSVGAPGGGGSGGGDPFKTAVIDTLVSRVQGDAGADRCVLLLGYRKEMETFIRRGNPGLARRFQLENAFEFDDYDDQALLRILLGSVARRGKRLSFAAAKQVIRRDLAKARMRPNFGNAGAVENAISAAVLRAESRLQALPAAERALQSELQLADFDLDPEDAADPAAALEGLVGCTAIRTRLAEYQAVVEAAARAGRDPLEDLALTFCFQGAPGTGKTTVARRMGQLFAALGVLPSAEVVQVSASEFSTGYVGQAAARTRDIFDSARGAVLFIDEAYRLYDPLGRSYMQEAVDEIVTLLTEERFRGKMVVIFAGYSGQMSDLLDKVNPGLKSRVSDVVDFPDFSADLATEIALQQLQHKRLTLPARLAPALTLCMERLVAAPRWANGRDVETFVRRVAVECATRHTSEVPAEALLAALATLTRMKGGGAAPTTPGPAAPPSPAAAPAASPFMTADPVFDYRPNYDVDKAVQVSADDEDEDEDEDDSGGGDDGVAEALEEAIAALGYSRDEAGRRELEKLLAAAVDGAPLPEGLRELVAGRTNLAGPAVDAALARRLPQALAAVRAVISYEEKKREELEQLDDEAREEEQDDEATIQERLRTMGPCPAGFSWFREGNGWRCGGGSHFVHDDDPLLLG